MLPKDTPLRPEEVAAELAVSVDTVLTLIHAGELDTFTPGRFLYRITRARLEAFKRSHTTASGWPDNPAWDTHLLTVKQVHEAFPDLSEDYLRGWVKRGVLRAVKIHRMLRLFPETLHGLKYGFPATTAKQRARLARRAHEER